MYNREQIINIVEKYRRISIREIADELNFSKSYVHQVLVEQGYGVYKIQQIPLLNEENYEQRISFAQWYLDLNCQT